MIGGQYVRTEVPPHRVRWEPWTKVRVAEVLDEALILRREESIHLFQCFLDQANTPPIHRIQAFLGDEENVSGGTMGEPRRVPEYVKIVNGKLIETLMRVGADYFLPPYSHDERVKMVCVEYAWVFIERDPE